MTCSICHDDSQTHNKTTCQFRPKPGQYQYTRADIIKTLKQQQDHRDAFEAHRTRIVEEARAVEEAKAKRLLTSSPDASRLPPLPEGWGAVEEQPEFLVAQ